jgi:hypothetical protein
MTEGWKRVAARILTLPRSALLRSSICPEGIGLMDWSNGDRVTGSFQAARILVDENVEALRTHDQGASLDTTILTNNPPIEDFGEVLGDNVAAAIGYGVGTFHDRTTKCRARHRARHTAGPRDSKCGRLGDRHP